MNRQTPRRGRPPLQWLTPAQVCELTWPTAVAVETYGRHTARTIGRVLSTADDELTLVTTTGHIVFKLGTVKRARIVPGLYEPGDPVLKIGIPAALWRGGVVRTEGTDVLVEQIDGAFVWLSEDDLEPPETRLPAPPAATAAEVS